MKISIEQYLEKLSETVDDGYGKQIRECFKDNKGSSELGMLVSPSSEELSQLQRAVAIMTDNEKKNAHCLTDEQVLKIAEDAKVDSANFAIFMNGFAIEWKRVSQNYDV